jgi:hypothetical protein
MQKHSSAGSVPSAAAVGGRRPAPQPRLPSPTRDLKSRQSGRPVTAKSAALLRELEDQQTEENLESGFLIKKQLQLEDARVDLCKRLETLDAQLAMQGPSRSREETDKIHQDLELFRELNDRISETPLDEEIETLIVRFSAVKGICAYLDFAHRSRVCRRFCNKSWP